MLYNDLIKKISRRTNDIINTGISQERIEELSFALNEQTKDIVADAQCTVCQECFKDGQYLCRMPCGHCFHKMCISKWFTNRLNESSESDNVPLEPEEGSINLSSSESSTDESSEESSISEKDEIDYLVNSTRHISLNSNDAETYNLPELFNSFQPFRNSDGNDSETPKHNESENEKRCEAQSHSEPDSEASYESSDSSDYSYSESSYDSSEHDSDEYEYYSDYDIEDDVPTTPKNHCPNCRRYCW